MSASSSTLRIPTARVFEPLLGSARYKGAHGGRGSGKSHFFAGSVVEYCLEHPGARIVCLREVQKSLKESVKLLIEDKIEQFGVGASFNIRNDLIGAPGDGMILFQGLQDHTAQSIKSLEGFDIAYVEEAQTMSKRSFEILRPTIRKEGSEIWCSWNPVNAADEIDTFLRGETIPPGAVVVEANYSDNPFFPAVLEEERRFDEVHNPDRYGHVWGGEYEPMVIGALWDRVTIHQYRKAEAPQLKRIVVAVDPPGSHKAGGDGGGCGIVVAGIGIDDRGYVLEDATIHKAKPSEWGKRVVAAYDLYEADAVVGETNFGGDMVEHTIQTAREAIKFIEVRATRGKHIRAEPVSALYSVGRISHVGTFPELEGQMVKMTPNGYGEEGVSPDNLDALVWALTELFPSLVKKTKKDLSNLDPLKGRSGAVASNHSYLGA